MSEVIVFEKRTCTTCKNLAQLLEERGVPFDRVEYHVEGLTEPQTRELLGKAGITARDARRPRGPRPAGREGPRAPLIATLVRC